jgi:nitrite reductase/ring-hydroxylating ferredoxin subunit
MPLIKLCKLTEICAAQSLGFFITEVTPERNIFIVYHMDQVYAYENQCPHTQGPLDWSPHQFLNSMHDHIQCSSHGALFNIADGKCVYGPCLHQSLQKLTTDILDGIVYVSL